MNKKYALAFMLLPAVAACGSSYGATSAPAPTVGASVAVKVASSPLGQILVDSAGNTLYAFLKDTDAKSTCLGACAAAWPPAFVDHQWSIAPGLASGTFSTIDTSGREQLIAGKWPLYRFAGDARPGDTNGQGSGGNWFALGADATLIK